MTSYVNVVYIKIVTLNMLYNFIVDNIYLGLFRGPNFYIKL
jgi:hypothetical protein